jgi:hypothetical protein
MPRSPVEVRQHFRGIYCLSLQGRRCTKQLQSKRKAISLVIKKQTFDPEDQSSILLQNVGGLLLSYTIEPDMFCSHIRKLSIKTLWLSP